MKCIQSSGVTRVQEVLVRPLNVPLRESFDIAGGSHAVAANVLVEARLSDGTRGFGECAPLPAFNGETQARTLAAAGRGARWLEGRDADRLQPLSRGLARELGGRAAARTGLEMALLDAFARRRRMPLWVYFGGAGSRLATDVTVPILPPERAARLARRIARLGVRVVKVKVGTDVEADAERVGAVLAAMPRGTRLLLDANAGYGASESLRLLAVLRRRGVRPELFEQPAPKEDLRGLGAVAREGRVRVAADESAGSSADVLRLAREGAAQVVNIKLMKSGVLGALEMARTARACGLGLMIGGMVESRLAMACAAHFAAGFGGFELADLDTPLFFARDPMRGVPIRPGGVWDLSRARAGIGVVPKDA